MAIVKYGYDVNYLKLESCKEYNLHYLIEALEKIKAQLHEGNPNVEEIVVETNSDLVLKFSTGSL